jgi:hypothetical protein
VEPYQSVEQWVVAEERPVVLAPLLKPARLPAVRAEQVAGEDEQASRAIVRARLGSERSDDSVPGAS